MKTTEEIQGHAVIVTDPRGVEHVIGNVEEFVRENYELFDSDDDIKVRKSPEHLDGRKTGHWTRADRGLRAIIEGKIKSWKDWTLK